MTTNWLNNYAAGLTEKDCMKPGVTIMIKNNDVIIVEGEDELDDE